MSEFQELETTAAEAVVLKREAFKYGEQIIVETGPNTQRFEKEHGVHPKPIVFVRPKREIKAAEEPEITEPKAIVVYFPGNAPEHPFALQRIFEDYGPVFMANHPTELADYEVYGEKPELYYQYLACQTLDLLQKMTKDSETKIVLAGTSLGGPATVQTVLEATTHKLPINFGGLILNATGIRPQDITPSLRKTIKAGETLLVAEEKFRQMIRKGKLGGLIERVRSVLPSFSKGEMPADFDREVISAGEYQELLQTAERASLGANLKRASALGRFDPTKPAGLHLTDEPISHLRQALHRIPILLFEPERMKAPASLREPFLPDAEVRLRDISYRTGAAFLLSGGHAGTTYTKRVVHYIGEFKKQVLA